MSEQAKPKKRPLTDAERHDRFKEMARELDADENPKAFDRAFEKVVAAARGKQR